MRCYSASIVITFWLQRPAQLQKLRMNSIASGRRVLYVMERNSLVENGIHEGLMQETYVTL